MNKITAEEIPPHQTHSDRCCKCCDCFEGSCWYDYYHFEICGCNNNYTDCCRLWCDAIYNLICHCYCGKPDE